MIVTFYSFKGGVGRSMAMANIARSFQLNGLNVVMVDWDLEAPGLETFFSQDPATLSAWRGRVGLMDLLQLYRQDYGAIPFASRRADAAPGEPEAPFDPLRDLAEDAERLRELLPPLKFSLIDVPPPPTDSSDGRPVGKLRMLTAGWREGERFSSYANAVQGFDWNDFYLSYRGHAYFEWLRTSLTDPELADVVLIDSRTGVTEMGGVCTRQLADVVVTLVAPNRQNVDGATQMATSFERPDLLEQRGNRPIRVVIVPSRVDVSATDVKQSFEDDFQQKANAFMPPALERLGVDFLDLRIPYVTKFAFQERLSVGEPDGDRDLNRAYASVATHVAWLAPESARLKTAMTGEFQRVFGPERLRRAQDFGQQFDERWASVPEEQKPQVRELLLRLVEVRVGRSEPDRARPLDEGVLGGAFESAAMLAERVGLLKRHTTSHGSRLLELAEPEYVSQRSVFTAWIEEKREFLAWRQRLRVFLEDWQAKGSDAGSLLQGSALLEALEMFYAADEIELLEDERVFIQASQDAARARAVSASPPPARESYGVQVLASSPAAAFPTGETRVAAARSPYAAPPVPVRRRTPLWVGAVAFVVLAGAVYGGIAAMRSAAPSRPTNTILITDSLVRAGRRAADDSNYTDAIAAYSRALDVDSASVEALRLRGEAHERQGQFQVALADFDRALALAPGDGALRVHRAQSRWAIGDTAGAIADLGAVPRDSLDVDGLRLQADILNARGQDSASLAVYAMLVQRGDTAGGQLGRGQALERLGNTAGAIDAYLAAAGSASDQSIITFAEARLKVLKGAAPSAAPVTRRVYLHFTSAADVALAAPIDSSLRSLGVRLARGRDSMNYEVIDSIRTSGEVRYFAPGDAAFARRVQEAVEGALAVSEGSFQRVTVRFMPPKSPTRLRSTRSQAGLVEIWLPPLRRPAYRR